jgi:SAM-dependent methyltransferase
VTEPANNALLQQQIDYYRARASEFDQMYTREGRYDLGEIENERWHTEIEIVRRSIIRAGIRGKVLELACGTGIWTQVIFDHITNLTAVDASPEMIAMHQQRFNSDKIEYVHADLFEWKPTQRYDAVLFGFWISHVPEEKFAPFWEMIASVLVPGGKFFFVDNLKSSHPTTHNHRATEGDDSTMTRRLNDGREFQIVKVYREPEEYRERLEAMGWDAKVESTENYLIYGSGTLKSGR